jgi:hypothetical protein
MWKREEGIAFWLTGAQPSNEPAFIGYLKSKLQSGLGLLPAAVKEGTVLLEAPTCIREESLAVDTLVHDGIAGIQALMESIGKMPKIDGFSGKVCSVPLLDSRRVLDFKLPSNLEARIQKGNLIIQAACLSVSIDAGLNHPIREQVALINALPKIMDLRQLFIGDAKVGSWLSHIEIIPYRRKSIKPGELADSERRSFLHEAAAVKGIPEDRAELLAVFRSIPIEMISKMRYLSQNQLILYTLCRGTGKTSTRVYDMAAVRGSVSKDIFLIPHRTRFRLASLN